MKRTGAQILVQALLEEGCCVVFGYPGGQVLPIYDALYQKRRQLRHVLTAHEQGAAHAADGYARATGAVGVVLATSGPGATNLVTGIANAYLDSIPLVAITGNVPTSQIGSDSFQEVDITGITLPITKHSFFVRDVARLADTVREAFQIARSGRPGPVLIDIPRDIQTARCDYIPSVLPKVLPRLCADEASLHEAAKLLAASERPYFYCGGGVVQSDAAQALLRLAQQCDAVIGCTLMGLSAVPSASPRALGLQGMFGHALSNRAQREADLLLVAGARFSERTLPPDASEFVRHPKIIHIDIDSAELEKNVPIYLGIAGDIGDALTRLCALVPARPRTAWQETIAAWRTQAAEALPAHDGEALTPRGIFATLSALTTPDTLLATDVGQHQMWAAQKYDFRRPRTLITSGGLGAMGFGLGAAIGAASGTGRRVVLVTGDGSFGMNLTELSTAVANRVPLTILLLRNRTLGMVRYFQTRDYGARYSATDLPDRTDFLAIARAYGCGAVCADTLPALEAALRESLSSDGVTLIECPLPRDTE